MHELKYPWERVQKGEAFFVPTLKPEELRVEALLDSQRYVNHRFKAEIGILNGMLGVLFFRG